MLGMWFGNVTIGLLGLVLLYKISTEHTFLIFGGVHE